MKRLIPFVIYLGLASGALAGWLKPSQSGFVIQTFTSYQPISGNNSGVIVTNGNSYQIAGDNTGYIGIGGPGTQFRGKNDGNVFVDGDGALVLGSFGTLASVTNRGKGSLLLGNLSVGQRALITDVGNASILLGAGTVSNGQAIVVGDGNESHGVRSVTADSFWGMGSGFHGNGAGLTNLPVDLSRYSAADGAALSERVDAVETNVLATDRYPEAVLTDGSRAMTSLMLGNAEYQSGYLTTYQGSTRLGNNYGEGVWLIGSSQPNDFSGGALWVNNGCAQFLLGGGGNFSVTGENNLYHDQNLFVDASGVYSGGGKLISHAPANGAQYVSKDGAWQQISLPGEDLVQGAIWKTNVWWAYATSNATERTAFTNVYLGR